MKKTFLSLLVLGVIISSCGGSDYEVKKHEGEVKSAIASNAKTDAELEAELKEYERQEEERIKKEQASTTTISFDKLKHDFGDVKADSDNSTYFTVTNTGDKPLIIEDVSASCGCTTPIKPEGPIAPGKSDLIEVRFHSKPGQLNEIIKTVTVTANTKEKVHKLEIRAFVKE